MPEKELFVEGGRMQAGEGSGAIDPVTLYIAQAAVYPQLGESEQRAVAMRASHGDSQARELLITSNLRLVIKVATGYGVNGALDLDHIQHGNEGLIEAVDRYNPHNRAPFSSFASLKINGAIVRGIDNTATVIRVPVHAKSTYRAAMQAIRKRRENFLPTPTDKELADELGKSEGDITRVFNALKRMYWMDSEQADDGRTFGETIPDDSADAERTVGRVLVTESVLRIVDELPETESKIIKLLYGIGHDRPFVVREIVNTLGVSKSSVDKARSDSLAIIAKSHPELIELLSE